MKKVLAVLLVLALCVGLTGCSALSITRTANNMTKLKSLTADLSLNLDLTLAMMDEPTDVDATLTGPVNIDIENKKGSYSLTVDVLGESLPILGYYEVTDEETVVYNSIDGGETWSKFVTPAQEDTEKKPSLLKSLSTITKLASSFEETGTETVRGVEAEIYSGALQWADLAGYVDLPAAAAKAAEENPDMDFSFLSQMDLSQLGSIPVTIGFDSKNSMIVKATMDLTGTMQSLVSVILNYVIQSMLAESGMDPAELGEVDPAAFGFSLDIHEAMLAAELYHFDAVEEIVIPEEALAAEEVSVADLAGA